MRKIIYSPGFGAGWTSWNNEEIRETLLTYPPLVEYIESGKEMGEDPRCVWSDDPDEGLIRVEGCPSELSTLLEKMIRGFEGSPHVCLLGLGDAVVTQVEVRVRIEEYDGSERIIEEGVDQGGWM
jgi:hypothetical protein